MCPVKYPLIQQFTPGMETITTLFRHFSFVLSPQIGIYYHLPPPELSLSLCCVQFIIINVNCDEWWCSLLSLPPSSLFIYPSIYLEIFVFLPVSRHFIEQKTKPQLKLIEIIAGTPSQVLCVCDKPRRWDLIDTIIYKYKCM